MSRSVTELWRSLIARIRKTTPAFVLRCASCEQVIEDTSEAIALETEEEIDGERIIVGCCCELCARRVMKKGFTIEEIECG